MAVWGCWIQNPSRSGAKGCILRALPGGDELSSRASLRRLPASEQFAKIPPHKGVLYVK